MWGSLAESERGVRYVGKSSRERQVRCVGKSSRERKG